MTLPSFAWDWIMLAEGGFADVSGDPGGRTQFGIAERWHPEEWLDGTVTAEEAKTAYARDYWEPWDCGSLDPRLGLLLLDLVIQRPQKAAIEVWQAVLGVRVDGNYGPVSRQAARSARFFSVQDRYFPARSVDYEDLIKTHPKLKQFRAGWHARLFRLQRFLLTHGFPSNGAGA